VATADAIHRALSCGRRRFPAAVLRTRYAMRARVTGNRMSTSPASRWAGFVQVQHFSVSSTQPLTWEMDDIFVTTACNNLGTTWSVFSNQVVGAFLLCLTTYVGPRQARLLTGHHCASHYSLPTGGCGLKAQPYRQSRNATT